MRTSVGPLPAAVYWRRRAVVLGAVLVGVLVLFLSCSGDDDPADPRGTGSSSPLPGTGRQSSPSVEAEPTFEDAEPGGQALPDPSTVAGNPDAVTAAPVPTGSAAATPAPIGAGPNVTVAAPAGHCTDAEVSVIPLPARVSIKRGAPVALQLKIKNIANRMCVRDVGADLQEIYVKQGDRKIWSSDICGTAKGSEILPLSPNVEREYNVTWNGHAATRCAGGAATGPFPPPGEYQLFGRLGGKVSPPVRITVVA